MPALGGNALQLPNVWGRGGALFAFSGMDGQTDCSHQLVGVTSSEGRGIDFRTDSDASLFLDLPSCPGWRDSVVDEVVAGDAISFRAVTPRGELRVCWVFLDKDTVIGEVSGQGAEEVRIGLRVTDSVSKIDGGVLALRCEDEEFALASAGDRLHVDDHGVLASVENGRALRFAISISCSGDADTAAPAARNALDVDVGRLFEERMSIFADLPEPPTSDELLRRTYSKCVSVQRVNCCKEEGAIPFDWTTPDRWPHKFMWIWDSAFHSLGLRHFAPDWARNAIKAVLSKQRRNGFIPHMTAPQDERDSNIIQPPILAWAAWNVHSSQPDERFLRYCYPRLKSMIAYDCTQLDPDNTGLSEWDAANYASGMDNSPRFDQPIGKAVDLNAFLANEMRYMERIAQYLGLHDEASDWADMRARRGERINEAFWDAEDSFYYDLSPDGRKIKIRTVAGFTPLFAGVCSAEQASLLARQIGDEESFWTAFPAPSVAADEATYSNDMWRGPVWVNYNRMIIEALDEYGHQGLASELTSKTLSEIARWYGGDGVIYEFYDSEASVSPAELRRKGDVGIHVGGRKIGQCVRDYNWTAAVFIDLLLRQDPSR